MSSQRHTVSSPADNLDVVRTKLAGRPLVLVGLMGAGKSCIGKLIAKRLGIAFFDADKEIEAAAGTSIAEIFNSYGEQAFRDVEAKVIKRLLAEDQIVLATGGGAFMNDTTRSIIAQSAVSLWLKADLDLLIKRTAGRTHRPLLNVEDPSAVLAQLIHDRYPVYASADVTFVCGDDAKEATCDQVVHELAADIPAKQGA